MFFGLIHYVPLWGFHFVDHFSYTNLVWLLIDLG